MNRAVRKALTLAALIGISATAQATIQSGWPLLAFAQEQGCEMEIAGNGRFLEIRALGLIPGESVRITVTNGDMTPIVRQLFANGSGNSKLLYIPFRFGQPGGTVGARIEASRCTMTASAPWTRTVRVID